MKLKQKKNYLILGSDEKPKFGWETWSNQTCIEPYWTLFKLSCLHCHWCQSKSPLFLFCNLYLAQRCGEKITQPSLHFEVRPNSKYVPRTELNFIFSSLLPGGASSKIWIMTIFSFWWRASLLGTACIILLHFEDHFLCF